MTKPKMVCCEECDGTGEVSIECRDCGGTGEYEDDAAPDPDGLPPPSTAAKITSLADMRAFVAQHWSAP